MRIELHNLPPGATLEESKKTYYAEIAGRTRRGRQAKIERGGWPHKAPLGYRNVWRNGEKIVEIDPVKGPLVRQAFVLAAKERASVRKVLKSVSEAGSRTRDGKKLQASTLQEMLTKPFYSEQERYAGEMTKGSHEALVTKEVLSLVRGRLASRKRN